MASKNARPGRVLVAFILGIGVLYGLVALNGTWKPELGLDLQGGTRITLTTIDEPSEENLEQARSIIDQRVNGSGVAEADVTTQSGQYIIVEIPGSSRRDLVDVVKRQAQLRFRVVACTSVDQRCGASAATPQQPTDEEPGSGVTAPSAPEGDKKNDKKSDKKSDGNGGKNRPPVSFADNTDNTDKKDDKNGGADDSPSSEPTADATQPPTDEGELAEPLVWMDNPDPASVKAFQDFQCPTDGSAPVVDDDSDKPLVTCDSDGIKYLLSTSMIEGTELDSADAGLPDQTRLDWAVNLDFNGEATDKFTEISRTLFNTQKQFAIVLDGQVLSAPTMNGLITNGQAQITGNFDEQSATDLATSLKYGALPIAFEKNPTVQDIGPSLAGNQLSAGLWAGGLGLGLVMLYCLLYYRGLGIVVLGSLAVAALITYALVLLLGVAAGFTLTLPGIAGLIIAVGVTADSFILFFERIRDEMREGKSMRVAVETGWKRAKVTRLAANTVSLLSAAVLYLFATGAVKGFGFALGLSTLIDLAVLFWFTKPAVSWLARFPFFHGGGKLSGLSKETLGMDTVPAGGKV